MTTTPQIPVWKKNPLVRITLVYMAGIMIQHYCNVSLWYILFLIATASVLLIVVSRWSVSWLFRYQLVQGLLLKALILLTAMVVVWLKEVRNHPNWFYHKYKKEDYLLLQLTNEPTAQSGRLKAMANVFGLVKEDKIIATTGKLQLYFGENKSLTPLHYGSNILVSGVPKTISDDGNPGGFDFKTYANNKQFFHSLTIKKNWVLLNAQSGSDLERLVLRAREQILGVLKEQFNGHPLELGIAEALLIGYVTDIDKDLQQAYSNTGVVHIIAISGMHLALIYVLLVFIFSRLPFIKNHPLPQLMLVLACLWFFSLLTGASASVCRAAVMFTFISIGNHFNRTASVYNAVAASAFILLLYDPGNLFDVGFQLSYLAVLSIVIFQKHIQAWWHFQNKWIQKIWELAAVSISAQVLTFPICIYYFHQFPNLFLIANMLAVPLSSIILYCLMALLVVSKLSLVTGLVSKITVFLITCLNQIIFFINEIPLGTWKNISVNLISTAMLYLLVIGISSWLILNNKRCFFATLSLILIITVYHASQQLIAIKQQKIIVYKSPQHSIVEYISGHEYAVLTDHKSMVPDDKKLYEKYVVPANCFYRVDNLSLQLIQQPIQDVLLFTIGNKYLLTGDSNYCFSPLKNKIKIHLLVISKDNKPDFKKLLNTFEIKQVVFDATNSVWKIDKWEKECEVLHLPHHQVSKDGAFVADLLSL